LLGRTGASTYPSPFSPAPALSSEDELEPDNSSGRDLTNHCPEEAVVFIILFSVSIDSRYT